LIFCQINNGFNEHYWVDGLFLPHVGAKSIGEIWPDWADYRNSFNRQEHKEQNFSMDSLW